MATEDTFTGAKNAFTFYGLYLNTVAQEIGMERALALHSKTCETAGAVEGKAMKDQVGVEQADARTAFSLTRAIPDSLGVSFEAVEQSSTAVRIRCGRCSVYEGFQAAALDEKTREILCRAGSLKCMDSAAKQLNPKLSVQLVKFRSGADDFCEEQVVLA